MILYKITTEALWEQSKNQGYLVLAKSDDVFIHFAEEHDCERVISKYFCDQHKVIILQIDSTMLPGRLVYESNPGSATRYYHLYQGAIPQEAIIGKQWRDLTPFDGITILHNPNCSKSRAALNFLQNAGVALRIREYLSSPLTALELRLLQDQLSSQTMIRTKEPEFATFCNDSSDPASVVSAIAHAPKLLERPILIAKGRASIARTPEALDAFLDEYLQN